MSESSPRLQPWVMVIETMAVPKGTTEAGCESRFGRPFGTRVGAYLWKFWQHWARTPAATKRAAIARRSLPLKLEPQKMLSGAVHRGELTQRELFERAEIHTLFDPRVTRARKPLHHVGR